MQRETISVTFRAISLFLILLYITWVSYAQPPIRPKSEIHYQVVQRLSDLVVQDLSLNKDCQVAVEDCISFNHDTTQIKYVKNGYWKIVDGSRRMFDFGNNESETK